jgi:hypothetical protein
MPLIVESKRKKPDTILRDHPGAQIIDVTSNGEQPWVKFSPFYPHGGIPVPLSPGHTAASVEGIWQGLKVFENERIDLDSFKNTTMKNLKRTVRTHGNVLGHCAGVGGKTLLAYGDARVQIYLPAYKWILENCLLGEIEKLQRMGEGGMVALLDYETNSDLTNLRKPLSHASLVVRYLRSEWPS